jgi:hypothetical protein
MNATPILFDSFAIVPPPHFDDDGSGFDSVRQPAKTCHRNGGISWYFFGLNSFSTDDTATSNGSFPMTRI